MGKFVPKSTQDDAWKPLVQHRDYAVLSDAGNPVFIRFGQGHGMYMSVDTMPAARMINSLDFGTGEPAVLGKLSADVKTVLGRTSECAIKVMHAIVSRNHLELTGKSNVLILRDLGSTNGTFVL